MGQPIRKKILDSNPNAEKEKPFYTLLVDGNSLLFMCMRDETRNSENVHVGGILQFLIQLKKIMEKRNFDYVYVFFDDEYSGWLRWNLYKPYKYNRDKNYADYAVSDYMKEYNQQLKNMQNYIFNKNKPKKEKTATEKVIEENFNRERNSLMRYFEELYIRCYMDDITEGDDLIAYYCKNKKENELIYIMSGDMDITQLLDEKIALYELHKKKFITKNNFKENFGYYFENTLVKKIFCGDSSDNIGNIKGLSEERFEKLMPEYKTEKITVEDVKKKAKKLIDERLNSKKKPYQVHENIIKGISNKKYDGDFYEINKKIIDLKNPLLSEKAKNIIDDMMYAAQDPSGRSFSNLYKLILEDGIDDLKSDTKFASFFKIFKKLEEKEIERFKESLK